MCGRPASHRLQKLPALSAQRLGGKVPYRDLYEQKGPVLYFLFALSALPVKTGYLGVWITEVISFALFLFYSGRIAALYLKHRGFVWLILPVLGFLVCLAPAFDMGGGVEELHLCCFVLSLFYILRALQEKRLMKAWESLLIGACTAAAFWSKYTFCGFYAGLVVLVLIWYLSRKELKRLGLTVLHYLGGFAAVTLPVLLYFWMNHALDDLIQAYFINNITLYARTEKSAFEYAYTSLGLTFKRNFLYSVLWIPGGLLVLIGFIRHWKESLAVLLSFAGLVLTTYMRSPGYIYYGLVLAPYALAGMIMILLIPDRLLARFTGKKAASRVWVGWKAGYAALLILMLTVLSLLLEQHSSNTYAMSGRYRETPQARFAAIIREVPDAAVYNYRFLDGGFYYAAGVLPVNRFFCHFNIDLEEQDTEARSLVESGRFDFIVTRTNKLPSSLVEKGGYELVCEASRPYSSPDKDYNYYLYRRK